MVSSELIREDEVTAGGGTDSATNVVPAHGSHAANHLALEEGHLVRQTLTTSRAVLATPINVVQVRPSTLRTPQVAVGGAGLTQMPANRCPMLWASIAQCS